MTGSRDTRPDGVRHYGVRTARDAEHTHAEDGNTMHGCDLLFDADTAARVRAEIVAKMGRCPCDEGRRCPLLPDDLTPLLTAEPPVPPVA